MGDHSARGGGALRRSVSRENCPRSMRAKFAIPISDTATPSTHVCWKMCSLSARAVCFWRCSQFPDDNEETAIALCSESSAH